MFGYEDISLNFAYHLAFLLAALLLLAVYTTYVYRFTIPLISKSKKIILVCLRTLALVTILLIFFEPVISFTKKIVLEPVNLIFIDNSSSIKIDDGTNRPETVKNIISDIASNQLTGKNEFFLFGNKVRGISNDSLKNIDFSDGTTNLSELFNSLDDDINYSSIVIISDGVYTEGSNPTYKAANLPVPLFTIGIGDTTTRNDAEVSKVLFNDIIYAETPTSIIAAIQNKGFDGESVLVSLFENNQKIEEQTTILNKSGIQNLSFDYTPTTSGKKKLSVSITNIDGEFTYANNKKIFYVNVLSNKIKVMVLAGSPSTDLTFIKSALNKDENLTVNSLTQISSNRFVEDINYSKIDSADILFLVGFPGKNTPVELLNIVKRNISEGKMPYCILFSPQTNFQQVKQLQPELSFSFNQQLNNYREVQPEINLIEKNNPLLMSDRADLVNNWNNLPPVSQPSANFTVKPGSKILSTIKLNNNPLNIPLIVTRNFSGKKSVTFLAGNIWRWKLQTARKNLNLFDSFILNCVKWLNTPEEQKKISVKTSKNNYSPGEMIEFLARVSDESLNPVDDAEIKVKISSSQNSYEVDMQNTGNGLYEGTILLKETGDFNFQADIFRDGVLLGKDNGAFNVGEINIELINPVMNYGLLELLAGETNGGYYTSANYEELFSRLKEINKTASKEKIVTTDLTLWSSEWLLVIAILLFSLEWFLRKRTGML